MVAKNLKTLATAGLAGALAFGTITPQYASAQQPNTQVVSSNLRDIVDKMGVDNFKRVMDRDALFEKEDNNCKLTVENNLYEENSVNPRVIFYDNGCNLTVDEIDTSDYEYYGTPSVKMDEANYKPELERVKSIIDEFPKTVHSQTPKLLEAILTGKEIPNDTPEFIYVDFKGYDKNSMPSSSIADYTIDIGSVRIIGDDYKLRLNTLSYK